MLKSVIYQRCSEEVLEETRNYFPKTEPICEILTVKVILFVLIFILGEWMPQLYASFIIAVGAGI